MSSQSRTFSSRFSENTPAPHTVCSAYSLQPTGNKWRKRVRVERTGDRKTCHPPVLKTGMITGSHALPLDLSIEQMQSANFRFSIPTDNLEIAI